MARRIQFVATDCKTLRVGQRLYVDAALTGVPEPVGWQDWPADKFERWIARCEPIKIELWTDQRIWLGGMGAQFFRGNLIAEISDEELRRSIYRRHLNNMRIWKAQEQDHHRTHPDAYRGIRWNCNHVIDWGNSIEFQKTYAARVNWLNVYDPVTQKTGINAELLTGEDARRFAFIAGVRATFLKYRMIFVFIAFLALAVLIGRF